MTIESFQQAHVVTTVSVDTKMYTGHALRNFDPVTKFGGQPVWLSGPQWPLFRDKRQMRFIAQVRLPGPEEKLAYLFMDDPDFIDPRDDYEPTEMYTVIVQPSDVPPGVPTVSLPQGPTLRGYRPDGSVGEPVDLSVEIAPYDQPDPIAWDMEDDEDDEDRDDEDYEDDERPAIQIGGRPYWLQGEEAPGDDWPLLLQIDSAGAEFSINCGDAGIAYAFLNPEHTAGVFFIQSC